MNKNLVLFACLTPNSTKDGDQHLFLPAYGDATFASQEYMADRSLDSSAATKTYIVSNSISGSIVNSADTISLIDAEGEVVDVHSWATAPASGRAQARIALFSMPTIYAVNNGTADWNTIPWASLPQSTVEMRLTDPVAEPGGPEDESEGEGGESPEIPDVQISPIMITEIFANASGADAGKEFIELFNPNENEAVSLDGFRLRIGLETAKWYNLPADVVIPPLGYVSFSDTELGFSLVNTNGGVQLYQGDKAVGDRIEYSAPKEGKSWSLVEGVWQYTDIATPGQMNRTIAGEMSKKESPAAEGAKPCAVNQFRNPETGRCKLLSSSTTTISACKVGQERNPETNRCRNIVAAATPTPCKEGQERNPETNRCRNITKMSSAEYGIKGIQNKADAQPSWYYWAGIGAVLLLILGYAVWEWREELRRVWQRVKTSFAK